MPSVQSPLSPTQLQWDTMYRKTLPRLAREKAAQGTKWPVRLDHCFARIILDIAVGKTMPWTAVVKAPATRNMSTEQLAAALDLGERIANGQADLWALDQQSLDLRGKTKGPRGLKRKHDDKHDVDLHVEDSEPPAKSRKDEMADVWAKFRPASVTTPEEEERLRQQLHAARRRIAADSSLRPFRRLVLNLLTQVPRGRFTTYQALSDAAMQQSPGSVAEDKGMKSAKSAGSGCARAIGGAMRNNPFAPEVPCHRVVASDLKIGGFKGGWGEGSRFIEEKKRLLHEEGCKFDSKGKLLGVPFRGFTNVV